MVEGWVAHQGHIIAIGDAIDDGIDVGAIVECKTVIDLGIFGVSEGCAISPRGTFGHYPCGGGFESFLVEDDHEVKVCGSAKGLTNVSGQAKPNR